MLLARAGVKPTPEWYHDNELVDGSGMTVAMISAQRGDDIEPHW